MIEKAADRWASESRFGNAILSQLEDSAYNISQTHVSLKYNWQALIAADLDDNINGMLVALQEHVARVDDQEMENKVNKLQRTYSDIPTGADPEVIVEQLQGNYEFATSLYASLLAETVSALEDEDWRRLANLLETIADVEEIDGYDRVPQRWEPSRDLVENQNAIIDRRDSLANSIVQFDESAPENYERRFRYGSRYARLRGLRNTFDEIEAHVENGELLRAFNELQNCQNDLEDLAEVVERDGFDQLSSQVSVTEDRMLELDQEVQEAMTGPDQSAPASATETVNWRPTTDTEESTELPDHEVIEEIGSGGNADVRKVKLTADDQIAALKIPRWQGTMSTDVILEFTEEAETWESIDDHDHIVSVYDTGTKPYPWMLLEYMEAGSLRDRLSNGMTVERPIEVLVDICEAVSHAHRYGIAHNDLKPANILFNGDDLPKVADWGLAKVLLDHSTSVEGLTPQYAAPEQLDPDEYGETDDTTDIYQLGVIAYELLTGELPYDRPNPAGTVNAILEADLVRPSKQDPDLPTALSDVIMQAMAPEKADRYEHILYFRDDLQEISI